MMSTQLCNLPQFYKHGEVYQETGCLTVDTERKTTNIDYGLKINSKTYRIKETFSGNSNTTFEKYIFSLKYPKKWVQY